jgi:hypothetical protein
MAVLHHPHGMTIGGLRLDARATQLAWFAVGATLAFFVPYIFSSALNLQRDLYYLIYFASVGSFLAVYVRSTGLSIREMFRRSLPLTLIAGVIIAGLEVMNIVRNSLPTPHPLGAYFGFELLWRGLVYGTVDALLLSAFPAFVAFGLLGGRLQSVRRHAGFAALALALTIVITATYHLGYAQYQEDGVLAPEQGNVIITLPTLIDANPIGSVVAHATMHVAANLRSYETPVYLPPASTPR